MGADHRQTGHQRPGLRRPRFQRPERGLIEWLGVLAFCSLVAIGLIGSGVLTPADNLIRDSLMAARPATPDSRILVVAIDNRSLDTLGRWPWGRDTHARLLDRLSQDGAAAVGLDILFTETSDQTDPVLAQALRRSGQTCLPTAVDPAGVNGAAFSELPPVPALADAAAGLGQVNLSPDADGVVRRSPLVVAAGARTWEHLTLCMLRTAGLTLPPGSVPPPTPAPGSSAGLGVTAVGISFPGSAGAFRTVSYVDLLNGEVPPDLIAGRLVLVGMTADGQGDRYVAAAPRGQPIPGVEIQAAMLDTLLSGRDIQMAPSWAALTLALVCLGLLMTAFLVVTPRWGLLAATGMAVAALGLSAVLFWFQIWLPPLGAVVTLALACPLWSWRRLATTSGYLGAELDRLMVETAAKPDDGRLFSDDVVARQVSAMQEAVARLRGVNRFIGDTLESLPDAALVAGADDRILYANGLARRLLGRGGEADLLGDGLPDVLRRLHPDLKLHPVISPDESAPTGTEVVLGDGRCLRIDHAPLTDGTDQRLIVRLADVTGLRAAERRREQALQLLGHDMRAPQTAILTLLEQQAGTADPALLDRIGDCARLTLSLADGYVRLARAEDGPLTREILDIRDVLTDAMDILWPVSTKAGVRIVLLDGPDVEIEGDRSLLTRAVMNLLDNAVKHSPSGATVDLFVEALDDTLAIEVRDQGPGLSQDQFADLLQPFSHGSDRRSGVGLGLTFVSRVAARHGGSLSLRPPHSDPLASRPGSGATFRLTLPLLLPEPNPA